ncbi:MAG: hypothetical protein GY906_09810 [bacterium]|nr:hypothetical protein [bacterium]
MRSHQPITPGFFDTSQSGLPGLADSSGGISYSVCHCSRLVMTDSTGVVKAKDLFDHIRRIALDPNITRPYDELWDTAAVTAFEVESPNISRLASMMLQRYPEFEDSRIAVVAPSPLVFGMMRMLQTLTECGAIHIEVFRERRSAEGWIRFRHRGSLARC